MGSNGLQRYLKFDSSAPLSANLQDLLRRYVFPTLPVNAPDTFHAVY